MPRPEESSPIGDDRPDERADRVRPDPRLLEEVLQQTSLLLSNDTSDAAEDIECLRAVARQHGSDDFGTALPKLVHAMLERIFGDRVGPSWGPMTNAIAESLLEDPNARIRVENLWKRLTETQS